MKPKRTTCREYKFSQEQELQMVQQVPKLGKQKKKKAIKVQVGRLKLVKGWDYLRMRMERGADEMKVQITELKHCFILLVSKYASILK